MSDKQAYEKKLEAKLEEWQADIDKLRAKAKQAGAEAQIDYQKQIETLRQRRDEMQNQLTQIRNAQTAAWSDIKAGADKAWDEMSSAMQKAWSRVG